MEDSSIEFIADRDNHSCHAREHSSPSAHETPSRASCTSDTLLTMSQRSSSAPLIFQESINSSSLPVRCLTPSKSNSSVKHLTCYWWRKDGNCRFSDNDCLYAHRDTGQYASAPRQLIPGLPAMAGRRLEQAARTMAAHKSSTSLSSLNNTTRTSRPDTPTFDLSFTSSSSPLTPSHSLERDMQKLEKDNNFLHEILAQSTREKNVLMSAVEHLQNENKKLNEAITELQAAHQIIIKEHNTALSIISEYQRLNSQNPPPRNPFGVIGSQTSHTRTE